MGSEMKKNIVGVVVCIVALLLLIPTVMAQEVSEHTVGLTNNVSVTIPELFNFPWLKIYFVNWGNVTVTNINVTGKILGMSGIFIMGSEFSTTIDSITSGETVLIKSPIIFGLGKMIYYVEANYDDVRITETQIYFTLGSFMVLLT